MRHNVGHRKLGRVTEHRLALLRNQAIALLRHEKIETTMPKAKELRPFVERLITIARRGVAAGDVAGKTLHARRLVLAEIPDTDVVGKLFETLAPRFADRPGGYTRILRVGYRRGDSAEVAHVELVAVNTTLPSRPRKRKARARRRRRRRASANASKRAAQRMRSGKGGGGSKAQAGGQTRGKAQKSTTPRKAGGS
jgi:large subunit ribosomal protein L17